MEIVTEPDLRSSAEAKAFLDELKLLLTYLGVSDCNMQEGSLRVDANVNLHIDTPNGKVATPIVEIKNMNSFRAVERALDLRSRAAVPRVAGNRPACWASRPSRPAAGTMRPASPAASGSKEESSDYRYFPDPDLVPVSFTPAESRGGPQRRWANCRPRCGRGWRPNYGLSAYDADVLVNQGRPVVDYFLAVADGCGDGKAASNWVTQDVLRVLKERNLSIEQLPVSSAALAELIGRIKSGELPSPRARDVFQTMVDTGVDVAQAMALVGNRERRRIRAGRALPSRSWRRIRKSPPTSAAAKCRRLGHSSVRPRNRIPTSTPIESAKSAWS